MHYFKVNSFHLRHERFLLKEYQLGFRLIVKPTIPQLKHNCLTFYSSVSFRKEKKKRNREEFLICSRMQKKKIQKLNEFYC